MILKTIRIKELEIGLIFNLFIYLSDFEGFYRIGLEFNF